MPALFTKLDAKSSALTDRVFGERLRIEPRVVSDYSNDADPLRPIIEPTGTLTEGEMSNRLISGDRQSSNVLGMISRQEVWTTFDRTAFTGELPRRGDWLTAIERTPVRTYEISAGPFQDGVSRIGFMLVRR